VSSFVYIDDAAAATAAAVQSESDRMGVYNIVDDEPAPVAEWLPAWPLRSGQASPARARVAGSPVRGRTRGGHDDRVPRRQRQGQAGPRVAAVLPELADRLQSGPGEFRGHQGGLRTNEPVA
jgi:nucleoside-diphosphate-sugar epimerase